LAQRSVEQRLFEEPHAFDFFQAVRLLEMIDPARESVGRSGSPGREVVRFRALPSLNFPPSPLYDLTRAEGSRPPVMTVAFFGLHGPSGVMPRHYTEMIFRLDRERKGEERRALREWFDLFNHRLLSLFYRAGTKYRFWVGYERNHRAAAGRQAGDDVFLRSLESFAGIGTRGLSGRLTVSAAPAAGARPRKLAGVEDQSLLFYAGLLAQQKRNAVGLAALLRDYFGVPVEVEQFVAQWLQLEPANQTRLGGDNGELGVSTIAGEKVLDYQGKFRIRLGPLDYATFTDFLPDRTATPQSKAFFLLSHLTRLYVRLELDFEVQLVLRSDGIPECQLAEQTPGPRLGWNTWLISGQPDRDAADVCFPGEEVTVIEEFFAGVY
jgi:type VI secretion system protein ImpH